MRRELGYSEHMIEKQEVQEIFPTPLWIVDLKPVAAAALNIQLKAEIERLIAPRPVIPAPHPALLRPPPPHIWIRPNI